MTFAARYHPRRYDVIALFHLCTTWTNLFDDTCRFMAGNEWQGHIYMSEQIMEI
jgi:hypothetical protein